MDTRRATDLLLLLALAMAAAPVDADSPPCRKEECPHPRVIRFYEELGCEPSDGSTDCCPTRYDCSTILSRNKTKCYYQDKAYDPGTQIQVEITSVCTPTCTCLGDTDNRYSGESTFNCAHIDCPEYFESEQLSPDCYRMYRIDQCCSTRLQCGNATEGREELLECVYNGRTFLEGQYIEVPESECVSCICQEGFNGTLDGPWCRRFSCDFTLGQRPSELTSCAPIFWKERICCPMGWHCPSRLDTLMGRSEPPPENDNQCTFGKFRLNIGDEFRAGRATCVICRCDIPPFVTCAQFPDSECESIPI